MLSLINLLRLYRRISCLMLTILIILTLSSSNKLFFKLLLMIQETIRKINKINKINKKKFESLKNESER